MIGKIILSIIFGVSTPLFFSSTADAKVVGGFFGSSEKIHCIEPLKKEIATRSDPRYPNAYTQPKLYKLCYKLSFQYFILGVAMRDDGYVLAEKEGAALYIPLSKGMIAEYQEKGILPKPLPPYEVPLSAYIIGYSLWLLIGVPIALIILLVLITVIFGKLSRLLNRGKICRKCDLFLTENDFSDGKCSDCGEPTPA